jgi:hypothetical protein
MDFKNMVQKMGMPMMGLPQSLSTIWDKVLTPWWWAPAQK